MADLIAHIEQAKHNEECALSILQNTPQFRDWAITAAFYAAVHFAEASFATKSEIGHTETAKDRRGLEPHKYRLKKIKELARPAYHSYQKLYNESQNARYLTHKKPAVDYYSISNAQTLVQTHLPTVRAELEKAFGVKLD